MDVRLRSYTEGDLNALVALDALCFAPEFLFDRGSMREFAEARNAITLLEVDDDEMIAGFVIVHLERAGRTLRGYILTLDVAAPYRRSGVASRLMQAAEEQVHAAGSTRMDLHVYDQNQPAIAFYERHGYLFVATRRGFYGPGMHALSYRKDLGS